MSASSPLLGLLRLTSARIDTPGNPKAGSGSSAGSHVGDSRPQLRQRGLTLALLEVFPDPAEDPVQNSHISPRHPSVRLTRPSARHRTDRVCHTRRACTPPMRPQSTCGLDGLGLGSSGSHNARWAFQPRRSRQLSRSRRFPPHLLSHARHFSQGGRPPLGGCLSRAPQQGRGRLVHSDGIRRRTRGNARVSPHACRTRLRLFYRRWRTFGEPS